VSPPPAQDIFIGLMTGTSADALDAVAVDFGQPMPRLLGTLSYPLPDTHRASVRHMADPAQDDIDQLGTLDRQIGHFSADAVLALLASIGRSPAEITAIGSHGQTVRHRPPDRGRDAALAFSLQLGDPNTIAETTGITTVADFRRRDIAAGGQGAPLVPAFHAAVFASPQCSRAIVNIGGFANITLLPAGGNTTGYDTGPGNVLLDEWIYHSRGFPMDRDGRFAAEGRIDQHLLAQFLSDPFFQQPAPRSTGREQFNLQWIESSLARSGRRIDAADVQATLVELTTRTIMAEIDRSEASVEEILVCGGGAHNPELMASLARLAGPRRQISDTSRLGIPPDWVEACAFAWLARQCLLGLPGNCPQVTGARHPVVLGAIYPGVRRL